MFYCEMNIISKENFIVISFRRVPNFFGWICWFYSFVQFEWWTSDGLVVAAIVVGAIVVGTIIVGAAVVDVILPVYSCWFFAYWTIANALVAHKVMKHKASDSRYQTRWGKTLSSRSILYFFNTYPNKKKVKSLKKKTAKILKSKLGME